MSELDGISPKELEQFKRKHFDTHHEIKAISALEKGGFKNSSLIKNSPGDKNAAQVKKHKRLLEAKGFEKQKEALVDYLVDGFTLRRKEILDKDDLPIKDLLAAIARFMPQKIDGEQNVNMNFADMVKEVTLKRKQYKAIDAEDA